MPSSLLVPLIVTVISTWSEAQSWSLLLFLPHLSPASQLLADVCVCVCEPTRDRAQPHMEEERETTCRLCNSAPLTGRAATLLSPVVLPQQVQVPARASSLAWRYGQGKSPILSLKTSDPQYALGRARRPGLGEFERSRMLPLCHCGRMLTSPRVKVVQPAREEYSV